jgi:hypothetical protein
VAGDQVWTPVARVAASKMDWLISKHLNPSVSEGGRAAVAAAAQQAKSGAAVELEIQQQLTLSECLRVDRLATRQ